MSQRSQSIYGDGTDVSSTSDSGDVVMSERSESIVEEDTDGSSISHIDEVMVSERSESIHEDGTDGSSGSDSDSSEEVAVKTIACTRSRRAGAGNKMQELIQQAKEEDAAKAAKKAENLEGEDVAMQDIFAEVDDDMDFEEKLRITDSEPDSDFDDSENDEEDDDAGEKELQMSAKPRSIIAKSVKQRELMYKKMKTARVVEANVVDEETQARYMKEAVLVAQKNRADLVRIDSEIERVRSETLIVNAPKAHVHREDTVITKHYYDENGNPRRALYMPEGMWKPLQPSQLWLDRQKLLPPKPEGFDDMPYERV
uniref:YL1 domain-containing protein n=1 Tax=Panagrellus redivivus TaxID=6233 RepID=A0A7E4W9Y8_PANRE